MNRIHKTVLGLFAAVALATGVGPARADAGPKEAAESARADIAKTLGFVPQFFQNMADAAVSGAWGEMKGLQLNPNSALPGKTKELVGLAVAAQVPCQYCIYAHTEFAKLNGATNAEIAEAVAVGAFARQFSTYANGLQIDAATFRADFARMFEAFKKPAKQAGPAIAIVDAVSARKDIERTLGFVPAFLAKLPETALPGAWRELKDLRVATNSALPCKVKALISLAVASQTPSDLSIAFETEFAKFKNASEREIAEAVGMAAITRNLSTMLNGQQTDDRTFRADIERLVAGAKAAAAQPKAAVVSKK